MTFAGDDRHAALTPLVERACVKQVVVLGELPSHGEARGFQAKAEIVEQLVDRCGFSAVFFEAPVYEFFGLEQAIAEGKAMSVQLDNALGGFWKTKGLQPFRQWLFEQSAKGELVLAGLDDQVSASSVYARQTLPDLVAASVPSGQSTECGEATSRNLFWRYDADRPFDRVEQARLQRCSREASETATAHTPAERLQLDNLANLYARQTSSTEARDRDEIMHRNFRWHFDRLPEGSKVVVWTATVHAARTQGTLASKPLGAWLADDWGKKLLSVGFTTYRGQSSMAGGAIKTLPDTPTDSLEATTTGQTEAWVYLNKTRLSKMGSIPSRLFGSVRAENWSYLFDAVLVIGEEVAPIFEQR